MGIYTPHLETQCVHLLCCVESGKLGGKISGSRCMLRPGGVLEDMFWNIDMSTCVLVGSEFP